MFLNDILLVLAINHTTNFESSTILASPSAHGQHKYVTYTNWEMHGQEMLLPLFLKPRPRVVCWYSAPPSECGYTPNRSNY